VGMGTAWENVGRREEREKPDLSIKNSFRHPCSRLEELVGDERWRWVNVG